LEPHSGTINKVSEFCPFSIKSSITTSEGRNDEKKELRTRKKKCICYKMNNTPSGYQAPVDRG